MTDMPVLFPDGLPEIEKGAANSITQNLADLSSFVNDFSDALALFDYCEQRKIEERIEGPSKFGSWQLIAAKYGAQTVYNFGMVQRATQKLLGQCPTLMESVDKVALRDANSTFAKSFPDFETVRTGAAHGDLRRTPKRWDENISDNAWDALGVKIEAGATVMFNALFDREYVTTANGRHVSYKLSRSSLKALQQSLAKVAEAFVPADAAAKVLWQKQLQADSRGGAD